MKLGIVGNEAAKFTEETRTRAFAEIVAAIERNGATEVCSGECHLGGVDAWAHEVADRLKIPFTPFPPKNFQWEPDGYKERNLKIANWSDKVVCIVVRELPADFHGMRFSGCYHCKGRNPEHVKSGGCWTAWKCKDREWVII